MKAIVNIAVALTLVAQCGFAQCGPCTVPFICPQTILQKRTAHLLLLFLWSRGHPDSGPGLIRPAHFQSRGPSHGPIHCPYHGHFLDPGFGLSQSSTLYKPCRKRRLLYRGSAELAAKWWLDLTETGAFLGPIQL
uniref:Putative conserved secreted protein n=1 Tax=Rhipicephalus microplus TaxID=6941 RepID=A0A6G5A2Z5_RHIMP